MRKTMSEQKREGHRKGDTHIHTNTHTHAYLMHSFWLITKSHGGAKVIKLLFPNYPQEVPLGQAPALVPYKDYAAKDCRDEHSSLFFPFVSYE